VSTLKNIHRRLLLGITIALKTLACGVSMAKMSSKISFFFPYLGGGGAETVMLNLLRGMMQQEIEVELILGKAWGPHLWKIPDSAKVVDLQAGNWGTTLLALSQYLKKEKPLALIAAMHYGNEVSILAKRLAGVETKVVVTEHNTFSQAIQSTSRTRKVLIPLFVKTVYPLADHIVVVSKRAAEDLARSNGLAAECITAIYNPVVNPSLLEKAQIPVEHPWFQPGEPPVILGVGKLERQKDFPTLLKAFAQVQQHYTSRLVILGWGALQAELEALAKDLGVSDAVALLGYVENPYAYMARAATFVLSSAWEGLPTVLIEAMAVGIPVVSTDCPSGPAEILDNGKYGALVPVGDQERLANAILTVLQGSAKPVDPAWLHQFTLAAATENYLNLIHSGSK
jgi:glycosyltransferase involved in cell wall biosynthesis